MKKSRSNLTYFKDPVCRTRPDRVDGTYGKEVWKRNQVRSRKFAFESKGKETLKKKLETRRTS